ncbi:MAG: cytochrome c peroxidase [Nevskia sp.]
MRAASLCASLALGACGGGSAPSLQPQAFGDPPEVVLGERLFLETRFAQFFAVNSPADVNAALSAGDPALATLPTADGAALAGPFRTQSMNCRQCHLVDEAYGRTGGGNRTYADFARRSRLTERGDGPALTVRNSPALVDATLARATGFILHFDGEFTSAQALVRATLTGRNTGWLPNEQAQALAQVAKVIREDDGRGALAAQAGGAYRTVLSGSSASLVLPAEYRLDVGQASDAQILDAVARLIAAYVESLSFARNGQGLNVGAPYDLFLARNALPATPAFGESALDYARRLRASLDALGAPDYVPADVLRRFQFHPGQAFQFGETELRGLRVFLREPASASGLSADELARGGIGNCLSCHAPPAFTDFGLHNTGVTQLEYDGVHAAGAFAALAVPSRAERGDPAVAKAVLPATSLHPGYESRLRAIPVASDTRKVDLGAWNIFANADFPLSQAPLRQLLCDIGAAAGDCANRSDDALLTRAIATFKTPGLRDLADSQPYMHNGRFDTIEDSIGSYATTAAMARAGRLRNADPRLANVAINARDEADLAAFLRALNEDYH